MKTPTLEDLRRDPELRTRFVLAAHHQRNEAIGRLFARLYRLLKPAAVRHAARPDLASQG